VKTNRVTRPPDSKIAEEALRIALRRGPMRPRDIRALAREAKFDLPDDAWNKAKRALGIESFRAGKNWYWQLPGNLEVELAAWLCSPQGLFEAYLAQRDRLGPPPGTHGELTLDDVN